ncbi:transglutaminase-like domain-containing protein [Actinokineospora sp.]|uniref:transglutaminase-like domain-containing protein n=1 Tax=Actinokineospora sp. TaxID=1872133 RepID=UPI0040377B52
MTAVAAHGGALGATPFLDIHAPEVRDFVERATRPGSTPAQQAVDLYYAVRDGVRYEVYGADLSREGLRAGSVAATRTGMCAHKSVLFAAGLRSLGIPARLLFADVRNHLTSPRLRELMGGDVFRYHCYTTLRLDGRWIRATPVFNRSLCRLFGLTPLEFDGSGDSVHHPFDGAGRRHMEFLREHGEFDDVPYDRMIADMRAAYPGLIDAGGRFVRGSLARDAGRAR